MEHSECDRESPGLEKEIEKSKSLPDCDGHMPVQ